MELSMDHTEFVKIGDVEILEDVDPDALIESVNNGMVEAEIAAKRAENVLDTSEQDDLLASLGL